MYIHFIYTFYIYIYIYIYIAIYSFTIFTNTYFTVDGTYDFMNFDNII